VDNSLTAMASTSKNKLPKLNAYSLLDPAEPLRKRAPAHDENGKPLSDFMMIFPGLKHKPQHVVERTITAIESILANHEHAVVFAELNLRLSLLWVSIRQVPGIRFEIASGIQALIPEARLVSHI